MSAVLKREDIDRLIPHGTPMVLLDEVVSWDADGIVCLSASHLRSDNPLLCEGELPSAMLLEYGAQAAAVHAGLQATGMGEEHPAYIGGIKDVKFYCDAVTANVQLTIKADAQLQAPSGAIYLFSVYAEQDLLVSGRLTLVQPT